MAGLVDLLKSPVRAALKLPGIRHWRHRYAELQLAKRHTDWPATDDKGRPMPGPYLVQLVAGGVSWQRFLEMGEEAATVFSGAAARHGKPFAEAERILDLGCGCGRIIRHLPDITGAELHGADYNARLVKWCRQNLNGQYVQNSLMPPLPYGDDTFDIIYLFSVFTHLRLESQRIWLKELARVTRPGGVVIITFHDEDHPQIAAEHIDRAAILRDGFLIRNDFSEGSNFMASFQTRALMADICSEHFRVGEIQGTPTSELNQPFIVLVRD